MSANSLAGGWLTSAARLTSRMRYIVPSGDADDQRRELTPADRREPQGTLRLLHRRALRGGNCAAGVGSESHARRPRAAQGSLLLSAWRRGLPDWRPPLASE